MTSTTHDTALSALAQDPPDVETMRATARRLLGPDGGPGALPPATDVDTLTLALRGHLALILTDVEQAVGPRPSNVKAYCALACVGEARRKLTFSRAPSRALASPTPTAWPASCSPCACTTTNSAASVNDSDRSRSADRPAVGWRGAADAAEEALVMGLPSWG
ncbi:DUF6415 family natural product biosynthesis protein [Streptomyces sp. NPDC001137]|uniref:DUF6415 family natural product biosynthesis protein n=1 Tax=Streptomyces sp. NPDC001137 TaxID=3154378 RepID=UPI003323B785